MKNKCICLQPLSQYKKKNLYRHVESFELADPSLFEDARIGSNLAISRLSKKKPVNITGIAYSLRL